MHSLLSQCAGLAHAGVDLLLVREKDLPTGELVALSRRILAAIRQQGPHTRVLVASRPDVALAAQLDGVHLASHPGELTPEHVRQLYRRAARPDPIITLSCHTLDDIRRARRAKVSAALFAPVFGKTVLGKSLAGEQVTPPAGLEALRAVCREAAPIPVFALGGVTWDNAPSCLQAGAAGIAGIRLFLPPSEPRGDAPRSPSPASTLTRK
jgi:thiamine-phosphate pyrophosphorylase